MQKTGCSKGASRLHFMRSPAIPGRPSNRPPTNGTSKSSIPKGHGGEDKDDWENEWTQTAVRDALTAPEYDGKIVVMTWEHNHIASDRSDPENTLRHL